MTDQIKDAVKRQFGASAASYATSEIHARGGDLALLPKIAGLNGSQTVLDVATAAGNTALALAPHARQVVGVDLTPEMLAEATRQAQLRQVANVRFAEADAEHLPFPDASFDVVTCRIAAHHFPDPAGFCREAARVLKPGGLLVVVDNVAPEDDGLDTFINTVEKLRDPSHFRAWRLSEWEQLCRGAGLGFTVAERFPSAVDREDWLARMNVPAETAARVRQLLAGAPEPAKAYFQITTEGFMLHKAIITARKS